MKTKRAPKKTEPTIKELFRSLDESMQITEAHPVQSNLKGQIRRRRRLMLSMLRLMGLHERMERIEYHMLQEQFRKHSRFCRKAIEMHRKVREEAGR
jgi:hypothetical protein